ncbi:MAG: type III-A CRISPR-associated protein Cas10/Csm1 [Candidatus Weimeria sp.]
MQEQEIKLVIGALLHDIGKVVYRTGDARERHSILGADYLKEKAALDDEEILRCVRYHHAKELSQAKLPENDLAYIVYIADNIASATDRRDADTDENGFDIGTPLASVFNLMNGNHGKKYYTPGVLKEDEIRYPTDEKRAFSEEEYKEILYNISDNLRGIVFDENYVNSLLEILESELSYVPSSTSKKEVPDISLYDHLRLTAGTALCIKKYLDEKQVTYKGALFDRQDAFYSEKCFRLASLDISGIQKFIYTITSKNALRHLRARSFYLDLLMEHVTDELLDREGLCRANLIYSGGGHCYIILPATDEAESIFQRFLEELNEWFIREYSTDLYIAGADALCSSDDLKNKPIGSYSKIYMDISEQMSKHKSHRYSAEQIRELNTPRDDDHTRECSSCKHLGKINNEGLCPVCAALKRLSADILHQDFYSIVRSNDPDDLPLPFGCTLVSDTKDTLTRRMDDDSFIRVYGKNKSFTGKRLAKRLFVGDYSSKGETFEEYAEEAVGIDRIGILRADVDNLGQAFVAGFKDPSNDDRYLTLSRTAAFSRHMSMFFKMYINDILAHPEFTIDGKKKDSRKVSVVYSGGDDVFLAGAWDDIIETAVDLRNDLKKYAEGTLTISAGIGIYEESYPISVMASEVADLEEKSKYLPGKDAITLLEDGNSHMMDGHEISDGTYHWDEFIDKVLGEKYKAISDYFSFTQLHGNAFLYRILELLREMNDRINFARYVYMLSRLEPTGDKVKSEEKEAYSIFSKRMYSWVSDEKDRRELKTAITIYVYLHREGEDGEDNKQ